MKNVVKYFVLAGVIFLSACTESFEDNIIQNSPPETYMFLYSDTTVSQQRSRIIVHWWGDDPDGLVTGYYFIWEGLDSVWHFTTKNDSLFSLPIGSADTTYQFKVAAIDNSGNNRYDDQIIWNNINLGPEPFIDKNNDGIYNSGETYFDIGLIDPTPAGQVFPIKNTAPEVQWNELSILPLTSLPVMTVAWDAEDLDGNESITDIYIALNDTTEYISLGGSIRLITLRVVDYNVPDPMMEILINGSENNIHPEQLANLILDGNNRLYVQAKDISGAKSGFVPLPDTGINWYVKKPKGELLIVDNYPGTTPDAFYTNTLNNFSSGALNGKYDILNMETEELPFQNVTFVETLKLFNYILWYSGSKPDLELAGLSTQKFLSNGGKIFFSMTFEDSSEGFDFNLTSLQTFLPIESLGQPDPVVFVLNATVTPSSQITGYPLLQSSTTIGFVRTYNPNENAAIPIYDLSSTNLNGNIAFMDQQKSLFFIGLPLHSMNGISGSVQTLLEKVFIEEFGLSP